MIVCNDWNSSPKIQVERFTQHIRSILRKKELNKAQSQTLSELRDTLLPRLISGEIRIPDAEKKVEQQLSLFSEKGAT